MYGMIFIIFTFKVGTCRAKNVKNGNVTGGLSKLSRQVTPRKPPWGVLGGSWGFPDVTTLTVYPL